MSDYTDETLRAELREAALPLMDFLKKHHHPHVKAIVSSDHIEVLEGMTTNRRKPFDSKHLPGCQCVRCSFTE